ncbi:hypothetical protein [Prolixibacter bellariivorans]|uniref:hypothetical protein n=1 Tax=Prolixibacter bellariivorans TaxID=314319 RepID=UPI0011DD41FA|nr:hypothetical protein [Prolixibacter bellariivorans]
MMKLLFMLGFLLASLFALAQPFGHASENYRVIRSDYENASGEKGHSLFHNNTEGQMDRSLWSLNDQSRSSANRYQYDAEGKLSSAYREFSDSLTSVELFFYDSLGRKTTEHFYRSDGRAGTASYRYDGNRKTEAELKKYKGWLSGTLITEYTEEGRKEKATLLKSGQPIGNVSYLYDDNGNLEREHWDFSGKWSQTFRYTYERTDRPEIYYTSPYLAGLSNHRVSGESYTFNGEAGGPSFYEYDANGLLHRKFFQRSDSVSTTTHYFYDGQRRLESSERVFSDGKVTRFTYGYDENNRLISRLAYRNDSIIGFEQYMYGDDGELKKAT